MKKILLLTLISVLGFTTANAQFTKGTKRLAAQTSAFNLNFSDKDIHLNLGAKGSYFLTDRFAAKAGVYFDWTKVKKQKGIGNFDFEAGGDYYFWRNIYGGAGLNFKKIKGKDFETAIKLEVGATHYLARNVYVNPAVYFNSGLGKDSTARFGLELGIGVNF
ncbi:MAG: hypothetical protein LBH12_01635 [Dysgonamonadaceae bacterium]|jgi:hypothetical protein|nr:hypothetical protein [Dysgonamonadaceae bacterium]